MTDDNLLKQYKGTKQERLQEVFNSWYGCTKCTLGQIRETTGSDEIIFGEGNPDADIVILGEAGGAEEEATSIPFVGPSGQLLNQILASVSTDPEIYGLYEWFYKAPRSEKNAKLFHDKIFEWRSKQYFITNVVACRPPENRTPNTDEIKACWERVWNTIYIIDPVLIVACGNTALSALLGKNKAQITKMRGEVLDIEYDGLFGKLSYPVIPTFHPSFLLRKMDWKTPGGDYHKTVEDWRKCHKVVDFLKSKQ